MRLRFKAASLLLIATLLVVGWDYHPGVSATVPYVNERVNLTNSGTQSGDATHGITGSPTYVSQDGRYVLFGSTATDLVNGDTNSAPDLFVRDRLAGTTTRVNVSNTGAQLSANSTDTGNFALSANGRFVAFVAADSALGNGSTGFFDVFLRDLKNNTTELISTHPAGTSSGNGTSSMPSVSADGRYVAFTSNASNLVTGDTNAKQDIFVRDRVLGTTTLLSKSDSGTLANGASYYPSISCDGGEVAFSSGASNLVSTDSNSHADIFVVNRVAGDRMQDITLAANSGSATSRSAISCDGSTVAFYSDATNIVAGDTNGQPDLFAYDIYNATFDMLDVSSSGSIADSFPKNYFGLSFDGRYVVFDSTATNLVSGDTNSSEDTFVRDRQSGITERISMRNSSTQTTTYNQYPSITSDGKYVTFVSGDTGLVAGDTNGNWDVFLSQTGY